MSAHTKGPWEVQAAANGGDIGILATDSVVGWVVLAECFSDIRRLGEAANSEAQANARLIAVAPELLALLKELVDIEGPQPGTSAWADKVLAVLEKVKP